MKKRILLSLIMIVLLGATWLFAAGPEMQWGGPGYDPDLKQYGAEKFSKLIARPSLRDEMLIEIVVDSKETVNEVGRMALSISNGNEVVSQQCWKAMRHLSAPWACSFDKADIVSLSGEGSIQVFDRSGRLLLEEPVDCSALSKVAQ